MIGVLTDFIKYLETEKNYSHNTTKAYKKDISDFITFLEKNLFISDINLIDKKTIRLYLIHLQKNYSKSSVIRKMNSLRTYFKYLTKRKMVTHNPTLYISLPKKERSLPKFITEEEIQKIFNIKDKYKLFLRDLSIFEVLYSTGIRIGELIELKISDVDFWSGMMKVHGKGSKERVVPIGETALNILKQYLKIRSRILKRYNKNTEYIFLNYRGEKISQRAVDKIFEKWKLKTNLANLKPHIMRHTFATHMLNAGCDIRALQEMLGHKSLSTTQIYTHLSTHHLKKIYESSHPRK